VTPPAAGDVRASIFEITRTVTMAGQTKVSESSMKKHLIVRSSGGLLRLDPQLGAQVMLRCSAMTIWPELGDCSFPPFSRWPQLVHWSPGCTQMLGDEKVTCDES
jgi:hypothetical protein